MDLSKQLEECEILAKLGDWSEALRKMEALMRMYPEHPAVVERSAAIDLGAGKLRQAEQQIQHLQSLNPSSELLPELWADLYLRQERWSKAAKALRPLVFEKTPREGFLEAYADTLTRLDRWPEAAPLYKKLLQSDPHNQRFQSHYYEAAGRARPALENNFRLYQGPFNKRTYEFLDKFRFWVSPSMELGAGVLTEVFSRERIGANEAIHRHLMTHLFEGRAYYGGFASVFGSWRTSYRDTQAVHELTLAPEWSTGPWRGKLSFTWNELTRDPVEALAKNGRINRLKARNSFLFFDRLEPGHEITTEWYHMDGNSNPVSGSDYLGYRIKNDTYVSLTLLHKPFISLNYHWIDSHWNQSFQGADTVIGYLPREQIHEGGLYTEWRPFSQLHLKASVNRGTDFKRRVDFINWFFETGIQFCSFGRAVVGYEYNYGDSGTSGSGNSQTWHIAADLYF